MPGEQPRVRALQERPPPGLSGVGLVDGERRPARGPGAGSRPLVGTAGVPGMRSLRQKTAPGEYCVVAAGVEDDLRQPAVIPLGAEERLEFLLGPAGRDVPQADRDEGGVPAPLVRVEARGGNGVGAPPVVEQHASRRRATRP